MPRHICVDKQGDDGHITGLRALQGDQVYFPDEYRGDMLLKKDQKTKIVVRVRNDEVGIEVDGKKIYYFKGRSFKLYLEGSNFFGVEEKLPISIGSWDSQFKIDSIVMSPLRNAEELAWKIDDKKRDGDEKSEGEAKPKESPNSNSKTADKNRKSSNPDQADEKDKPTGAAHSSDDKQPKEKSKPTTIKSDPKLDTKSIPQIGSFQVDSIDVYDIAISPDSKLVAIAPRGKQVFLYDVVKRKTIKPLDPQQWIKSLVFGNDSTQLFVGTSGKRLNESGVNEPTNDLQVWDPVTGKQTFQQLIPTTAQDLFYDTNRDVIFTHLGGFATVHGFRVVDGQLRLVAESSGHMLGTHAMAINRDYSLFASASSGGKDGIKLYSTWDNNLNKPHFELLTTFADISDHITSDLEFSDDKKLLAVATYGKQIVIIDVDQQTVKSTFPTESTPTAIAFSPDGSRLAVGTQNGLNVYETASGKILHGVLPDSDYVSDIEISDQRDTIVAAVRPAIQQNGQKSTIRIWNAGDFFTGKSVPIKNDDPVTTTNNSQPPKPKYRTWTSADGNYKVIARLEKVDGDMVFLKRKDNGETISVNLNVISQRDHQYLRKR